MKSYFCVMRNLILIVLLAFGGSLKAQYDSLFIRKIFDQALINGQCYDNLYNLCKQAPNRLTGSPGAAKAVEWGLRTMKRSGFDTVYLQKVKVQRWERGAIRMSQFSVIDKGRDNHSVHAIALGGSVGTGGVISANVVEVHSLKQMDTLGEAGIKGKFVFLNRPMDPRLINTFHSYGGCVDQRYYGAAEAAKYGAVGVLVRSMTLLHDKHPHTGSMTYENAPKKIPAVAISTADADFLHKELELMNAPLFFRLDMDNTQYPDTISWNVVGEIRGSAKPNDIITVGGHLDCWDVGEGAHDDGAGCVHSIEALRLLVGMGYRPRHTLRAVLFMNEENGLEGAKAYLKYAVENGENHVCAIESDRGGFSPRGFDVDGDSMQVKQMAGFRRWLEPYGLTDFNKGHGGADIGPLKNGPNAPYKRMLQLGFKPDPQRYFDYHHAETDVFDAVNRRELELGSASIAAMIFLLDRTSGFLQ